MSAADIWSAPYADRPVSGSVRVPGSKSLTNRYLLLAALATGQSTLHHPLVARDSTLMRAALQQFGVRIESTADDATWLIHPPAQLRAAGDIDAGLAGTVMRFVPAVAALALGETTFDGDAQARTRPIAPLVSGLRDAGVKVDDGGDPHLPFTVVGHGQVLGGEVCIDASASSQFISALLLAGARFEQGLQLRHVGSGLPSRPHIEMTLEALATVGVQAGECEPGLWRVERGPIAPSQITIEPDLSSAAPFLALAAVTGGQITVLGWPQTTTQAGSSMPEILRQMGAQIEQVEDSLTITGPPRGQLRGANVDLHDVGELTPVIAAVAAQANSTSLLRGIVHLRGHETDRLQALHSEVGRMGGDIQLLDDGLRIAPAPLYGATLQTYRDHRMAMAGAVLGAGVPGTAVVDVETTAKTYPGFAQQWSDLVG